jgi:hypothetical protein
LLKKLVQAADPGSPIKAPIRKNNIFHHQKNRPEL